MDHGPTTTGKRPSLRRRLGVSVLALVVLASLVTTTGVLVTASAPPPAHDAQLVRAQTAWLWDRIEDGAARDMQTLFPEGYLFTVVLTGLATADDPSTRPVGEPGAVERMRTLLMMADSDEGTAPFDPGAEPAYGVFHAGWTLLLAVELARWSESPGDVDAVRDRAIAIRDALDQSEYGVLEAYPGQAWPCDTTVAVAALRRADALVGVPGTDQTVERWLAQVDGLRDPATGLLPHRTTPAGRELIGPRGSSQSIIQAFWPDIEPPATGSDGGWAAFVDSFVDRRAGLVGVREYPRGTSGPADVDSGPLVLGLSASSSVVTLAAARRRGADELAGALDREVELVGGGITWRGRRSYAAGQLPVGDAFLAWARTRPSAVGATGQEPGPPSAGAELTDPPRWWLLFLIAALPGGIATAALHLLARPDREPARGPSRHAAGTGPSGDAGTGADQDGAVPVGPE